MLSVIIVAGESELALVRTLAVLVSGAAAGVVREVIVTASGAGGATAKVADLAGCQLLVSGAALGPRLKAAAEAARASWLMFLQPGTVLDATWIDDAARFIDEEERRDATFRRAAAFRPLPGVMARPVLSEALSLLRLALGGRPRPSQGLLIAKEHYDRLGGHRNHADPESDLLRRLGRRRLVILRSGALMQTR